MFCRRTTPQLVVASRQIRQLAKREVVGATVVGSVAMADVHLDAGAKPPFKRGDKVSVDHAALDPRRDDQEPLLGAVQGLRQQLRVLVNARHCELRCPRRASVLLRRGVARQSAASRRRLG